MYFFVQTIQCYKNAFFEFKNQRVISLNKKRDFEQFFLKSNNFIKCETKVEFLKHCDMIILNLSLLRKKITFLNLFTKT